MGQSNDCHSTSEVKFTSTKPNKTQPGISGIILGTDCVKSVLVEPGGSMPIVTGIHDNHQAQFIRKYDDLLTGVFIAAIYRVVIAVVAMVEIRICKID